MALPTLTKTWQFDINNVVDPATAILTQSRTLVLGIKNALKAFASSGWTVWGSCDGAGGAGSFGNGDASDRWVDISDLVWAVAGSNHSWIVLTQPGISAKTSICIDLSNASSWVMTLVLSPSAGFGLANGGADGTATARPTASDELVLISNTNYGANGTVGLRTVFHVFQSTDGKSNRIVIMVSGAATGFWMIEVPENAPAAWTPLVLGSASGSQTASQLTTAIQSSSVTPLGRTKIGAATVNVTTVYELPYATAAPAFYAVGPDDQTGENPFTMIGLYCTTAGHRGQKGNLIDLWFNSETVLEGAIYGQPYPEDNTYQFVNIGCLILPWNGTSKILIA